MRSLSLSVDKKLHDSLGSSVAYLSVVTLCVSIVSLSLTQQKRGKKIMSSFFYAVPEEIQERRDLCALIRLCEGVEENGDDASKMISSLLEKKPSFVSMEMHGVTPLLAAVSANNLKLIDVLCQFAEHHGEGGEGFVEYESIANDQTALIAASAMGYEKAVKKLCEEYKADANRITKNWRENGDDGSVRKR